MDKTLRINYENLADTANIMLCLSPPDKAKISDDNNMVAWKIVKARAGQAGSAQVKYSSRYGFGETDLDNGDLVAGSIYVEMTQGQSVDLLLDDDRSTIWGTPYKGDGKLLKAKNKSEALRAISVGTMSGKTGSLTYQPTFIWTRVGNTMTVEAQLTPKLYVFVNFDFQENEMIRGDITSEAIQTIDLGDLDDITDWQLMENGKGEWSLEPKRTGGKAGKLPREPKSDTKNGGKAGEPKGGAPKVNVNYGLKLGWNDNVSCDDAEDTISNIISASHSRGLTVVVDPADPGWSRGVTVSRAGETAATITNAFTGVLNDIIDSDWTVDDQTWSNQSGKQGRKDVIELIAPKSLAYYYAK